jgi:hypothetical protein
MLFFAKEEGHLLVTYEPSEVFPQPNVMSYIAPAQTYQEISVYDPGYRFQEDFVAFMDACFYGNDSSVSLENLDAGLERVGCELMELWDCTRTDDLITVGVYVDREDVPCTLCADSRRNIFK